MLGPKRAIMTFKFPSLLLALAFSAPAMATPAPVRDFQLPPAPSPSPTRTPQVQGPVDIDGPVPVRPRVIPTATPSAPTPDNTQAPAQTPAPRPAPRAAPPQVEQTPATRRFTPAARSVTGQQLPADATGGSAPFETVPQEISPAEGGPGDDAQGSFPASSLPAAPLPAPATQADTAASAAPENSSPWGMWLAILAAIIGAGAVALFFWSRRPTAKTRVETIEPPLAAKPDTAGRDAPQGIAPAVQPPARSPNPAAAIPASVKAADAPAAPLRSEGAVSISVQPAKLSRSMMNASLTCAITLRNRTGKELRGLTISGDLVTAHGKVPIAEQLCEAATQLPRVADIDAIAAGQAGMTNANFILPVSQVRTIAQGKARLYVPLLRLRIEADGMDAVTQTFVIGMKAGAANARVQPFRLDEMPQTYTQIGSRPLD